MQIPINKTEESIRGDKNAEKAAFLALCPLYLKCGTKEAPNNSRNDSRMLHLTFYSLPFLARIHNYFQAF